MRYDQKLMSPKKNMFNIRDEDSYSCLVKFSHRRAPYVIHHCFCIIVDETVERIDTILFVFGR